MAQGIEEHLLQTKSHYKLSKYPWWFASGTLASGALIDYIHVQCIQCVYTILMYTTLYIS